MPTYQYQCTDCGSALEVRQSFSDDSLTVCPECDGRLRKVFNAVGVVFKGSGFYRTDSRASTNGSSSTDSNGSKPAAESGTKDSGTKDSGTKSTTKSDSSSPSPTKTTSAA